MRCLIVDDSPQFLETASRLLEREGIEIVGVASTSAQGLERVEELHPDVTLVDVYLGAESGFDLVERIDTPTILVSTTAAEDLASFIDTSPALGFLNKASVSAENIRRLLAQAA
jgi:DNA-binding NarL/FixJ family response regulator